MMEMPAISEENPFIYGMSKQFVNALHELFDIMDNSRTGAVRYADIASQWEEDETDPYFPKGLINCLSKVTLPNGLLTFDRFCAGIKLCLLKNQVDITNNDDNNNGITTLQSLPPSVTSALPPPPLVPSPVGLDPLMPSLPPPVPPHQSPPALISSKPLSQPSYHLITKMTTSVSSSIPTPEAMQQKKPTASVSPVPPQPLHKNIANSEYNSSDSSSTLNANYQRAKSMPQLMLKNINNNNNNAEIRHFQSDAKLSTRENNKSRQIQSPIQTAKTLSRSCIMKTLQNWRDNVLGRQALEFERISTSSGSKENILTDTENYSNRNRLNQQLVPILAPQLINQQNGPAMRRAANKRREPRRHTVGSNGIDFYTVLI
jgi:hypothetical protein